MLLPVKGVSAWKKHPILCINYKEVIQKGWGIVPASTNNELTFVAILPRLFRKRHKTIFTLILVSQRKVRPIGLLRYVKLVQSRQPKY